MRLSAGPIPVDAIRKWKLDATMRLLGDTIGISDAEWLQPSLLPGWSRAHVATHVARNADSLRAATSCAIQGQQADCYPSAERRFAAIEEGADRTGLDLQIDLDTSAGALKSAWDKVGDWHVQVEMYGRSWPLAVLPLIRLHEVVLHHIDLACGFTAEAVDPAPARWLLDWALTRLQPTSGLPKVRIVSDSGLTTALGNRGVERIVRGTDARLWAWLTGRAAPDSVKGAAAPMPLLA